MTECCPHCLRPIFLDGERPIRTCYCWNAGSTTKPNGDNPYLATTGPGVTTAEGPGGWSWLARVFNEGIEQPSPEVRDMDGLIELLKQRRIWVAIIPVVVMVANALGVEITEALLTDTADKILAAVMSGLSIWSYFRPKA